MKGWKSTFLVFSIVMFSLLGMGQLEAKGDHGSRHHRNHHESYHEHRTHHYDRHYRGHHDHHGSGWGDYYWGGLGLGIGGTYYYTEPTYYYDYQTEPNIHYNISIDE